MADSPPVEEMESFWFQKEKKLDRLLPYFDVDKFNEESQAIFAHIKTNLGKSILHGVYAFSPWAKRLERFISVYGLRISKEDHAALIKLLYETIVTIGSEELIFLSELIRPLLTLINNEELLSPQVLQLPWKPLYDLFRRVNKQPVCFSPREVLSQLQNLIRGAQVFFPVDSTAEILATIMPYLSPLDNKSLSTHLNDLCLFLPTMPHHSENEQGYHLWMNDMLSFWDACNNSAFVNHALMHLFARLARQNVGRINWEPYMDVMFTQIMRSLKLPVLYKSSAPPSRSPYSENLDIQQSSMWIVACLGGGSSAQKRLTDLLRAVESYFNPANTGTWMAVSKLRNVVFSLPVCFVRRLFYERTKILRWKAPIPKEKCLTEDDITAFVESMCPIVNQVLIGHVASLTTAFRRVLMSLAWLRPNIIVPPIIERLMIAVTSETEPLRVSASLSSLSAVMRPMVEGARLGYPEGPLQVANLLTTIIPMIDFNDPMKAKCSLVILERLLKYVPLVDCSKEIGLHPDMTPEEEEVCRSTAVFKDCLMVMVDRVLSLVHFSSSSTLVSFDSRVQSMTVSVFRLALVQTPPEFFKDALNKLHLFIIENVAPGPMLGHVVEAFVHVNAEVTWKILLPLVTEAILNVTESENVKTEQTLSSELMHHLGLLKDLLAMGPLNELLPYMPVLHKVLETTLHLENLDGHLLAVQVWERIITLASKMIISNFRSSNVPYDSPPGAHLHIRDWGRSVPVKDVKAEWIMPNDEAIASVQDLINKFLPAELEVIESFAHGSRKISKEALQQSLRIIRGALECQLLLPFWDEPALEFEEHHVANMSRLKVETGLRGQLTMPDGSNMRCSLIIIMERLQEKLLSLAEDDTISCCVLVEIWRKLLLLSVKKTKEYRQMKVWDKDPISLPNLPRLTLLYGAHEHAIKRCAFFSTPLTATHARGLMSILRLATSRYSKVRVCAQGLLSEFYNQGDLVCTLLLPYLLENLKVDSVEQHERFKGTLYVLAEMRSTYNWKMSSELWLAVVHSKPTEKLSVIKIIEALTTMMLLGPLESLLREVSDNEVSAILTLCKTRPFSSKTSLDQEYVKRVLQENSRRNVAYLEKWKDLQDKLVDAIESGKLPWRHSYLAVACLKRLIYNTKPKATPQAVRCLLHCLVNDSIHIRKAALFGVAMILQQQKQETKFITVKCDALFPHDGPKGSMNNQPNSLWLQYDKNRCPSSASEWQELKFVHKESLGYIKWPEEVEIPYPNNEQPPFDDPLHVLSPEEMEVDKFFQDEKNIGTLVSYMSLEKSTFVDYDCFKFFSKLFRNTGDKYLPLFKPHIDSLLEQKLETQQIFLFKLLGGIIHGTKRWPYAKLVSLWDWLAPVIVAAHQNLCVVDNGSLSLIPSMQKRDPYTQHWLIEILMDDPLGDDASALGCRRLDLVSSILLRKNWRALSLAHRALEYVKPHLSHHLKNVRHHVGRLLGKVFHLDFQLPSGSRTLGPHLADFIASIVPQLQVLKSLNISVEKGSSGTHSVGIEDVTEQLERVEVGSAEQDNALRLFETVSVCMQQMLRDSPAAMYPCFYELLEFSILLEKVKDKELTQICEKNLSLLASAFTKPACVPAVLEAICKVDNHPSWAMRVSCLGFLQVLVYQNMPIFSSQPEWNQKVIDLVVNRLDDTWVEVQLKAGEVLSGMIHCHFIPNPVNLMEKFKEKVKIRLSRKSPDPSKLRIRHAGVVGLSAYVRAFPYDVPAYVPELIGILGDHLNDPHPISKTIRDTLSSFQRTHIGQWHLHRRCFTEEQLKALSDMVVPPPHYV